MKLIAIDDDELLLRVFEVVIEDMGWEVSAWASVARAMRAFQRQPDTFGGAIVDLLMPGQPDGIEVAKRLRKVRPDLPILFLTAYDKSRSAAVRDAVDGMENVVYVLKPLDHIQMQREFGEFFGRFS